MSKKILTLRTERDEKLKSLGKSSSRVGQIVDLALLSNGLLRGKELSDFIQRSLSLIEERK